MNSQLGAEPWGRYASGLVELVAAVLILVPRSAWLGSLIALGVICGAILSHLFVLGIEVQGDHGLLFSLALVVLAGSLTALAHRRRQLAALAGRLRGSQPVRGLPPGP